MELEFYKSRNNRIILTITRSDGSKTWTKLHRATEDHDLAHYAVEKNLKMNHAFYGLIDAGADISDFEDKLKQPQIGVQAQQAEYLVNLLQTEHFNAGDHLDIKVLLANILESRGIPMINGLTVKILQKIRLEYHGYISKLKRLTIGEKIQLTFELH